MAAKKGSGKSTGKRMTKAERKRKKQRKMMILGIEAVVVVVLIVALYFVTKLDKIHKDEIQEEEVVTNEAVVEEELLVDASDVTINDGSIGHMNGYRNIALFGVDARNNNLGKGVRSDTIIIASINETTKEIKLVSVYRDTYLNLGNDSYNKANTAYSQGGPKQAINMLNMNMDLNITDYVTVGWAAVADTVDALGGIQIEVDSEELEHLNNYQVETSQSLGRSYTKLTQTGLVTLDGVQAVSYCRIRYTAGDDFKRAERQREVIQALADKAKKASPEKLDKIANEVFPQTATSLTLSEILELLKDVASYEIVETSGFPVGEYRSTGVFSARIGDCVIPADLETNVVVLHEFLFGDIGDYEPSEAVQEYGDKIRSDTGTAQVYSGSDSTSDSESE